LKIGTKFLGLVLASVLIGTVAATHLQQVYAPRGCSGCVEFKKLTHEYEKNVINAIGDPNISPGPRELLTAYVNDVNRIFLGGPDTLPELLEQYQLAVSEVLINPPEPDKQQKHDQIKEFRQFTKTFEQGSINQLTAASIFPN